VAGGHCLWQLIGRQDTRPDSKTEIASTVRVDR